MFCFVGTCQPWIVAHMNAPQTSAQSYMCVLWGPPQRSACLFMLCAQSLAQFLYFLFCFVCTPFFTTFATFKHTPIIVFYSIRPCLFCICIKYVYKIKPIIGRFLILWAVYCWHQKHWALAARWCSWIRFFLCVLVSARTQTLPHKQCQIYTHIYCILSQQFLCSTKNNTNSQK